MRAGGELEERADGFREEVRPLFVVGSFSPSEFLFLRLPGSDLAGLDG